MVTTAPFDDRPRVREFTTLLRRVHEQLRTTSGIAGQELTVEEFLAELTRAAARDPAFLLLAPLKVLPLGYSLQPTPILVAFSLAMRRG